VAFEDGAHDFGMKWSAGFTRLIPALFTTATGLVERLPSLTRARHTSSGNTPSPPNIDDRLEPLNLQKCCLIPIVLALLPSFIAPSVP